MSLAARHIVTVTQGGLLYRNEEGRICWIDFHECSQNWMNIREDVRPVDTVRVGWRNTGNASQLDVEFFASPRIRFIFNSYKQRDGVLLKPMERLGGWETLDLTEE